METQSNETDFYEEINFHPSLDIKDDILVLGFRVKPEANKDGSELFVIATATSAFTITGNSFTIKDKTYYIDTKKRVLAKLAHRWSRKELDAFLKTFLTGQKVQAPLEIFESLKSLLKQHMDIDEADVILMCTWAIGTYFFPLFSAYPYLHIKAPKGSGKTQCLSFLNQVCFNATKARASLPALRDTVDSLRGTYLMDQADVLNRPFYMEDLLDILTDSYKRGGGNIRKMVADKGKNWNLEEFQAYSPKAFASIKELPEDLRDRCIVISLVRSRKNFKSLDEESPIWKETRGALYRLLIGHFMFAVGTHVMKKIEYERQTNPAFFARKLELWMLFDVMFSVLGVPENDQRIAKERFLSQYNFTEYQVSDLEQAIIEVTRQLLGEQDEMVLSPSEISESVDVFLFDEDCITKKQRAAEVGKVIAKFNLSSEKLPRSNRAARYRFKREQVDAVYKAYFSVANEDVPTQPCTPETNEGDVKES
ncbi:MAG: hypothetical protein ABSB00_02135 [Minisyncoccia bacterium]|jgi:hypothetical protein